MKPDFDWLIGSTHVLTGDAARSRICLSRDLFDAAHIMMDADEQLGQPIVWNGLPLTKIHHAAFDAHLLGIGPDYRIHVSDRLLEIHDGCSRSKRNIGDWVRSPSSPSTVPSSARR
jgi:putative restriction endonuclease